MNEIDRSATLVPAVGAQVERGVRPLYPKRDSATVLGLNDVDKQKLEEARQLAMSMTSHPVAFGTIEHTEKAGELLGLLWQEVLRLQCDLKDAQTDAKRLDWLMANGGLIFGHGWWALKTYADTAPDDPLGVLDWIDAAMLRAEDADARNEELAARAN